jgi:hypothetical protein
VYSILRKTFAVVLHETATMKAAFIFYPLAMAVLALICALILIAGVITHTLNSMPTSLL